MIGGCVVFVFLFIADEKSVSYGHL